MNGSDPKQSARELLEEAHPALVGLSHWIHANPEIGFQETLASGWVAEWLTSAGFDVEVGAAGMPTAVVGSTGPGPFHVVICAEYDALPAVGHACGHNIIAAAGVGAGLALASVADELGLRVTVMGTPAEEGGGGKIRLIDAGAFEGVHAALMVHPWPADIAEPAVIAVRTLEITYVGREAHAAGYPQLGVNAADALVVAQTAIGLLRQHLLPTDRVHGIVTKGGDAPNIIPAHTTAEFMVRATSRERLDILTEKVRRCFEAGALATGADVAIAEDVTYSDMVHDSELAALYQANAEALGRVFELGAGSPVSTDMGDVSYVVPSIHPMIRVESNGAVNHQPGFTDACATPSADQAVLDGALGMAWTVIDAALDARLRARLMGQAMVTEAIELAVEADVLDEASDALAAEAAVLADQADADIAEAAALEARARELADDDGGVTDEVLLLDASAQLLGDRAEAEAEAADEMGMESDALADEAEARAELADELVVGAVELQAEALESESSGPMDTDDAWLASPAEAAWQGDDALPGETVAYDAVAEDTVETEAVAEDTVEPEAVAEDSVGLEAVAEDDSEPVAGAAVAYLAYDAFAENAAEPEPEPGSEFVAGAATESSDHEAPVEAVAEAVAEGEPVAEAVAEPEAEPEFVSGAPAWLNDYDAPAEAVAEGEPVAEAEAEPVAEFVAYDAVAESESEFVAGAPSEYSGYEAPVDAVAEAETEAEPATEAVVEFSGYEPAVETQPEFVAYDAEAEAEPIAEFVAYDAVADAVAEPEAEAEPVAEFVAYDALTEPEPEPEFVAGAPSEYSGYEAPVDAVAEAQAEAEPAAEPVVEFSGYEPAVETQPEFVAYDAVAEPEAEPDLAADAQAEAQPEAVEFVGFDSVDAATEQELEPVAVAEVVSEGNDHDEESSQPAAAGLTDDWQSAGTTVAAEQAVASADEPTFMGYEDAQQPAAELEAEPEAVAAPAVAEWGDNEATAELEVDDQPAEQPASQPVSAHDSWEAEFEAAMAALTVTPTAEQPAEQPAELPVAEPVEAAVAEASGEATDAAPWTVPNDPPMPTVGDFEWIAAGPESGSDELART